MDIRIVIYQVEGSRLGDNEKTIAAFDPGGHTGIAILRKSGDLHAYGIAEGLETEQGKKFLMAALRPHQPGVLVYEKYLGRTQSNTDTQLVIASLNWIAGALNVLTVIQSPVARMTFIATATRLILKSAPALQGTLSDMLPHVLSATAHALCHWQTKEAAPTLDGAKALASKLIKEAH